MQNQHQHIQTHGLTTSKKHDQMWCHNDDNGGDWIQFSNQTDVVPETTTILTIPGIKRTATILTIFWNESGFGTTYLEYEMHLEWRRWLLNISINQ